MADDLVRRLVAGDASALEEAYHQHAARCLGIALRVLRDRARAEDAVQEAFLSLWRHREGLVVRTAGIAPWLATVARNAALAMLRADVRRAVREEREALGAAVEPGPVEALESKERAGALRTALDALPDDQRSVIRLSFFGMLTYAEVARRTGAPLGTVKRRAQLALRRMASALKDQPS